MAKGIDKRLDDVWRVIVKLRAGSRCEKCGKTKNLNSHHIFGRRNKSLRWNLTNGCCLCPACHVFSSTFSAHQTPTAFTMWIIGERGEEWHEELMQLANTPKKFTKQCKEEFLEELILTLGDGNDTK